MMLAAGTWLVPTLVAPHAVLDAVKSGAQLPAGVVAKAQEVIEAHTRRPSPGRSPPG